MFETPYDSATGKRITADALSEAKLASHFHYA